jgi:hypothetical protein
MTPSDLTLSLARPSMSLVRGTPLPPTHVPMSLTLRGGTGVGWCPGDRQTHLGCPTEKDTP